MRGNGQLRTQQVPRLSLRPWLAHFVTEHYKRVSVCWNSCEPPALTRYHLSYNLSLYQPFSVRLLWKSNMEMPVILPLYAAFTGDIEVAVNISSQLHRGDALPRLTASRRERALWRVLFSYPASSVCKYYQPSNCSCKTESIPNSDSCGVILWLPWQPNRRLFVFLRGERRMKRTLCCMLHSLKVDFYFGVWVPRGKFYCSAVAPS